MLPGAVGQLSRWSRHVAAQPPPARPTSSAMSTSFSPRPLTPMRFVLPEPEQGDADWTWFVAGPHGERGAVGAHRVGDGAACHEGDCGSSLTVVPGEVQLGPHRAVPAGELARCCRRRGPSCPTSRARCRCALTAKCRRGPVCSEDEAGGQALAVARSRWGTRRRCRVVGARRRCRGRRCRGIGEGAARATHAGRRRAACCRSRSSTGAEVDALAASG